MEAVLLGRGSSGTQVWEKLLILLFYDGLWRSPLQSAPMRLEMCVKHKHMVLKGRNWLICVRACARVHEPTHRFVCLGPLTNEENR